MLQGELTKESSLDLEYILYSFTLTQLISAASGPCVSLRVLHGCSAAVPGAQGRGLRFCAPR